MANNKRHNILQIGLSMLLFFALGVDPCCANDPNEINDPAEIVGVFQTKFKDHYYLRPLFARIDENVFRLIISAPKKCGKPTFTLFDKKGGNPYKNQDVQLKSRPANGGKIQWIITNIIENNVDTVHPELYVVTFDRNSRDPRCGTINMDISNIEISPYVFPEGDGAKVLTIKNNHYEKIQITSIWEAEDTQGYVILPKLSEPINLYAGETHTFELQPGTCPPRSAPEAQVDYYFSGKNMVTGNSVEFSIMVEISCIRELERIDKALKIAEEALRTVESEKIAAVNGMQIACEAACREDKIQFGANILKDAEKKCNAKAESEKLAAVNGMQIACENACKKVREEDRRKCAVNTKGVQKKEEL